MTSSLKIAENIAHLRKKRGITQDELASFLGVTKARGRQFCSGKHISASVDDGCR